MTRNIIHIMGIIIICLIFVIVGFILTSCATLSLKAPTTQMLIQDVTQTTGYLIGKKYPQFGTELLKYTQIFLNQEGRELVNYQYWKEYILGSLAKDEFLQLKFECLLNLIEMDLQLKEPTEQQRIIKELFKEFISGLETGIQSMEE